MISGDQSNNSDLVNKLAKTYLKEVKYILSQLDISSNTNSLSVAIDEIQNYFDQISCVHNATVIFSDKINMDHLTIYKIQNLINANMAIIKNKLYVQKLLF
jgi:hypothetical protein